MYSFPTPTYLPTADTTHRTHQRNTTSETMAAYGIIAYPFLERIRSEMGEIEVILESYKSEGCLKVASLPRHIPSLYDYDKPNAVACEGLQKHYHMLEEQEAAMVLATNDDVLIHRHLQRIKKLIDMIEKVLQRHRSTHYYPAILPNSLLSCYNKKTEVDGKAMHNRYMRLKDMEFKIALRDMQKAASVQALIEPAGVASVSDVQSSTVATNGDSVPQDEHLPSFDESQRAYS
ncbi:hypothetical protein MVEG_00459 [Podila verticillata NRRL 6337]